jgi:predicted AAA+ superfamily ATPase
MNFYDRLVEKKLAAALNDTPVILIHGSRQSGKTTLAKIAAPDHYYISFDDVAQLSIAKDDPIGFIKRLPEYVILDEIQRVPELFTTIKASVDNNRKQGRIILTGSANILLLRRLSDSLAGRMEIITLWPLSHCELKGGDNSKECLLGQILLQNIKNQFPSDVTPIEERITNGGYPEPLRRESFERKQAWYDSYIMSLVERDMKDISDIRHVEQVPLLLKFLSAMNAELLNTSSLSNALDMTRATTSKYLQLLQQIFIVDLLKPWYSNKGKRLIKTPKVHFIDTGLICSLQGISSDALIKDRNLFGHLLESYVYNELKRQASGLPSPVNFYHFRDTNQREVDIIIETRAGDLYAIEVKATSTVRPADFKNMKTFAEQHKQRFKMGILFYDGELALPSGEQFIAIPLNWL